MCIRDRADDGALKEDDEQLPDVERKLGAEDQTADLREVENLRDSCLLYTSAESAICKHQRIRQPQKQHVHHFIDLIHGEDCLLYTSRCV